MTQPVVAVSVPEVTLPMVEQALAPHVAAEFVPSERLIAFLERGDAIAAIVDRAVVGQALALRFLSLACCGTPWPVVELRHRATLVGSAPWAVGALQSHQLSARLWYTLRARVIEWHLAAAAQEVRRRRVAADVLCDVLYVGLLTPRPCVTIRELARQTHRTARAISSAWTNVFGDDPSISLKVFLRWVVFLRALAAHDGAMRSSERGIAKRLGISRATLDEIARTLRGVHLSDSANAPGLGAVFEFHAGVLPRVWCGLGEPTARTG